MKIAYTHDTGHFSSREGARIHGLVLHTTEGSDSPSGDPPSDLVTLGTIFDNEEASAHLGVNVDGIFGRYVADSNKAWAVCNFNPMTLSLEQIGFAAFSRSDWFKRHDQLKGAAEFLQYGHEKYGVPIRPGRVSGGGISRDGVFQHKDFGISGCGHSDCGSGYPQKYVELLARYFIAYHRDPKSRTTKKLAGKVNRWRGRYDIPKVPS